MLSLRRHWQKRIGICFFFLICRFFYYYLLMLFLGLTYEILMGRGSVDETGPIGGIAIVWAIGAQFFLFLVTNYCIIVYS